ncbi:hypothetical protein DFJ67_7639 [Asanoa ferruginea]|uniref:Uncharacterized protein n=1 Tax=Asanoa ferruginea TaxID=53367 RepID=A0A3D9ZY64_9ACTN|nr:hypothetical protein [Asanoa ferruginea]REG01555.1 hypothetical protein DFJ67_7639 [Asanoa ferruginea]GIF51516.1 hypothetical protein Afe04nite_60550 [Asanoa ferruginea]
MTEELSRRRPRSGRARKRAIRAHAARSGLPYSIAARQVAAGLGAGETPGSHGRTVYPIALAGRGSLAGRIARPAAEQLDDARLAARLPLGRAAHLVLRFPPGAADHGPFYAGEGRADLLAMLYLVAAGDAPEGRAWAAETGQETAIDTVCGELDRAARRLLDGDWTILWDRIDAAVTANPLPGLREAFRGFGDEAGAPWTGVRQVLDALLVVADDGHAPGTRVRTPAQTAEGSIVGAWWAADGPPIGYDVWFDGAPGPRRVRPGDVVVLAGQETGYPT